MVEPFYRGYFQFTDSEPQIDLLPFQPTVAVNLHNCRAVISKMQRRVKLDTWTPA